MPKDTCKNPILVGARFFEYLNQAASGGRKVVILFPDDRWQEWAGDYDEHGMDVYVWKCGYEGARKEWDHYLNNGTGRELTQAEATDKLGAPILTFLKRY